MRLFAPFFVLASALALAASSCSRVESPVANSLSAAHSQTGEAPAQHMFLSLVDRMFLAPRGVPHGGLRRVEYTLPSAGGPTTFSYDERVVADGHGRFALTPESVQSPAMTAAQRETFDLMQKQREGFFFSYRDFGVRNRELFASNYRVVELPTKVVVLGRACVELEVRRVDHAPTWYLLDVDEATGLVLRAREYTSDGHLLARVEFLEFTLAPVLVDVEWYERPAGDERTALTPEREAVLGFEPATPSFLPPGFQLLTSEVVVADGRSWIRRVYGDGVESLFLLHSSRAATTSPRSQTLLSQSSKDGQQDLLTASNAPSPITVRLCQVGPWTLAEAQDGPEQIIVVGKLGEADVVRVLQSSL